MLVAINEKSNGDSLENSMPRSMIIWFIYSRLSLALDVLTCIKTFLDFYAPEEDVIFIETLRKIKLVLYNTTNLLVISSFIHRLRGKDQYVTSHKTTKGASWKGDIRDAK